MKPISPVFIVMTGLLVSPWGAGGLPSYGQTPATSARQVALAVDSGVLVAQSSGAVIFSQRLEAPGHSWLRIQFGPETLADAPVDAVLRMTAEVDGFVQELDRTALAMWGGQSAYFNGDRVLLEVVSGAGKGRHRVTVTGLSAGGAARANRDLCDRDDRTLSSDPFVARLLPSNCTGFLIDDNNGGLLSAGHCSGGLQVAQFNVPLSSDTGEMLHPPPEDQYPIDPESIQEGYVGVGQDWAYFGLLPNSGTGEQARARQGRGFPLFDPNLDPIPQQVRVVGYGTASTPIYNRTQRSDSGPVLSVNSLELVYTADTTSGNSGSPVIDEATGHVVGIHHSGTCAPLGGNTGTYLQSPSLRAALAQPLGVLAPRLVFTPLEPPPANLPAHDARLEVAVDGPFGDQVMPGSVRLHLLRDNGMESYPMPASAPGIFVAQFPEMVCLTNVRYTFSARTSDGETVRALPYTPDTYYHAAVGVIFEGTFYDDFNLDQGWWVEDDDGLLSGSWARARPEFGGLRGTPVFDGDLSGICFMTGINDRLEDVDGGSTRLYSPPIAVPPGAVLTYQRWFSGGGATPEDMMGVDVSDDGGLSWRNLETLAASDHPVGAWHTGTFPLEQYIQRGVDVITLRVTVTDGGGASVIEAGFDAVRVGDAENPFGCWSSCNLDLDGNLVVDQADLALALMSWQDLPLDFDFNGDGVVDILDLGRIVFDFGPCPLGFGD